MVAIDGWAVESVTPAWIKAMLEGATTEEGPCAHQNKSKDANFFQDFRNALPFRSKQKVSEIASRVEILQKASLAYKKAREGASHLLCIWSIFIAILIKLTVGACELVFPA